MATVKSSVNIIRNRCGRHALLTNDLVVQMLNNQHENLLEGYEWSRKKGEIIIATRADKTDGTITITNGSADVDGSSTAFASTDVGSYLQVGEELYVVKTFSAADGVAAISLGDFNGSAVLYPGTTASGQSYVLFKRWYSLGLAIEDILSVFHKNPITEWDLEYLNWVDPKRQSTGSSPDHFARGPRDSNGYVQIEFWPRPSSPIAITLEIKKGHSDIAGLDEPIVPSTVLEWATCIDACYYLAAKTKSQIWLSMAAKYENAFSVALDAAKIDDSRKFGLSQQVKDKAVGVNFGGTDYGLDHDTGIW